jgi:hypothetical protein
LCEMSTRAHAGADAASGRASFAFVRALAIIAQYLGLDLDVDVLRVDLSPSLIKLPLEVSDSLS